MRWLWRHSIHAPHLEIYKINHNNVKSFKIFNWHYSHILILNQYFIKVQHSNMIFSIQIWVFMHSNMSIYAFKHEYLCIQTWVFMYSNMSIYSFKHKYLFIQTWVFLHSNMSIYEVSREKKIIYLGQFVLPKHEIGKLSIFDVKDLGIAYNIQFFVVLP